MQEVLHALLREREAPARQTAGPPGADQPVPTDNNQEKGP